MRFCECRAWLGHTGGAARVLVRASCLRPTEQLVSALARGCP